MVCFLGSASTFPPIFHTIIIEQVLTYLLYPHVHCPCTHILLMLRSGPVVEPFRSITPRALPSGDRIPGRPSRPIHSVLCSQPVIWRIAHVLGKLSKHEDNGQFFRCSLRRWRWWLSSECCMDY